MVVGAKIKMKSGGLTPFQFYEKVLKFQQRIDDEMFSLGQKTNVAMKGVISVSRKRGPSRSGNKLSNSIKGYLTISGLVTSYGIGKMSEMDSLAPYWRAVNYGGIVPPASVGWFGDGNPPDASKIGKGTEPFTEVRGALGGSSFGGGSHMTPKSPIRPMNFIQNTIQNIRWSDFWTKKLLVLWLKIPRPPLQLTHMK